MGKLMICSQFHWPAEHVIDSETFPLEAQLAFTKLPKPALAPSSMATDTPDLMVSVLFAGGNGPSPLLSQFVNELPPEPPRANTPGA